MNAVSHTHWSRHVSDAELAGIIRGHRARHGTVLAARICSCPRCAEARERERERARERKLSYRGTCERCGAPTHGAKGPTQAPKVCRACAPRYYGPRKRGRGPVAEKILRFIGDSERRYSEIRDHCGITSTHASVSLNRLVRHGLLERVARGRYRRVTPETPAA